MEAVTVQPAGDRIGGVLRRSLSRLGVHLRQGEAGPAILLFLTFFLLITFQYTTKSVRQSTFINSLGAEKLPYVYLFIAISSYPFLRLYSRFADAMRRDSLIIATCAFTAATMVGFWLLLEYPWQWVPFAFYVWISITTVMMVSQFWSFSSHVFDPRQARRLFAFIGAGGLLGGVIGGQVAKFATRLVGTRYALLVAGAILLLLAVMIWMARHVHPVDDRRVAGAAGLAPLDEARGGFELLRQSPHLKSIAAIMLLTVVVAQIVDLQFNWAVQQSTSSLDERTAFFGNFYSVIGIMAFVFQLIFTARIHGRLGVGFAMRVLPVSMAIGTIAIIGAAAGAPELILASALLLKTGENGVRYSLDQATRELLFLPIPSRARVKAKAFIDVFVQRSAKGIAALLLLPVALGVMTPVQAGYISVALIAMWLAATVVARRHYIASFQAGLKQKNVTASAVDLGDATALELVVQALGSTDAHQVIHALHLLQKNDRAKLVPPLLLYHESAPVRRATLRLLATAERSDALPLIERCLSDADTSVRAEAVAAVAALRRTDATSLMAPYLESNEPRLVSAAVVAVYKHGTDVTRRRADRAFELLLADDDPEARAEAARAAGAVSMPGEAHALTSLLADRDPRVVKAAIGAVRRRVLADGPSPIYAASLIALLDDRRLKHEARQALIAFGESVIPALLHFMNSPEERMWVRRAIPKTIAMIGGPAAAAALATSLRAAADPFLRRKIIEGLGAMPDAGDRSHDEREVASAIASESERYFRALAALTALGSMKHAQMSGPLVSWDDDQYAPTLLDRLLGERMSDAVGNIFGLLALAGDRRNLRDAHRSVASGEPGVVGNAVEYLDNTLAPALKRYVLPVVEDRPLDERLHAAQRLFSIAVASRFDVLGALVEESFSHDGTGWSAAALYEVYASRTARLYSAIQRIRSNELADPLSRETADWIAGRIDLVSAS